MHNARTIRANWGYVRREKQTVEDQRRPAATVAKSVAKPLQHPTHVDNPGISAQPTTGDGRPWTMCPLLRIRCSSGRCVPDRAVMLADTNQQTRRPICARICARDVAGQAETGETQKPGKTSCRRSAEPSAVTRDGPRRQRPTSYGS